MLHLVWVLVVDGNRPNYSIVSKKRHRIELLILRNSRDTVYILLEITVRIGNEDIMPRDARSVRISISASSLLLQPSIIVLIVQNGFRFDRIPTQISNTVRLRNLSSKFRVGCHSKRRTRRLDPSWCFLQQLENGQANLESA